MKKPEKNTNSVSDKEFSTENATSSVKSENKSNDKAKSEPSRAKSKGKRSTGSKPQGGHSREGKIDDKLDNRANSSAGGAQVSKSQLTGFSATISIGTAPSGNTITGYSVTDGDTYILSRDKNPDIAYDSMSEMRDSSSFIASLTSINRSKKLLPSKYLQGVHSDELTHPVDDALNRDLFFDFTHRGQVNITPNPSIMNGLWNLNISRHFSLNRAMPHEMTDEGYGSRHTIDLNKIMYRDGVTPFSISDTLDLAHYYNGDWNNIRNRQEFNTHYLDNAGRPVTTNNARWMFGNPGHDNHNPFTSYVPFGINFNDKNIGMPSFSGDLSSIELFNDIDTMKQNIVAYSKWEERMNENDSLRFRIFRPQMKSHQFISTNILPHIRFATFMYIVLDAIQGSFQHVEYLGNKLGIVDGPIKYLLNTSRQDKRLMSSRIGHFKKLFDHIPVDTHVINLWNSVKNGSLLADKDGEREDNIFLVPYFNILGYFDSAKYSTRNFRNQNMYINLNVPYGDPLTSFLAQFQKFAAPNKTSGGNLVDYFNGDANVQIDAPRVLDFENGPNYGDSSQYSSAIISYVRMTTFMFDFIMNLSENRRLSYWLDTYMNDTRDFFGYVDKADLYKNTKFSKLTPDFTTLEKADKPTLANNSEMFRKLLEVQAFRLQNRSNFRMFTRNRLTPLQLPYYRTDIVYDAKLDNTKVDMDIRGFVFNSNNPNFSNDGRSINGNFSFISLMDSVLIPFHDRRYEYIIPNKTSYAMGRTYRIDQGATQFRVYSPAVVFEYTSRASVEFFNLNTVRCISPIANRLRNHAGNQRYCNYFTAHQLCFFKGRLHERIRRRYIKDMFSLVYPSPYSYTNENRVVAVDPYHYFDAPQVQSITTRWYYLVFEDINVDFDLDTKAKADLSKLKIEWQE